MKKKIVLLITILVLLIIPVKAENNTLISNHTDKEKTSSSAITLGDNLKVDKEVDGISLVLGNSLDISSKQDYLIALGNTINLKDITTKDLFVAGNAITVDSNNIERDIYVAGNLITLRSSAPRDVFVAGNKLTVENDVQGDLKVGASEVIVEGKISGDAYIDAETITIEKGAAIEGKLSYPENATLNIVDKSSVNNIEKFVVKVKEDAEKTSIITDRLIAFINLLIIGLLALYFLKIKEKKNEKIDGKYIIRNMVKGLLGLLLVPMLFLVILFLPYGMAIGFDLIMLTVYIILIYLSAIPAAIYLGNTLLSDKIKNQYLRFTLVLLSFYVLRFVPVVGGIVTAAVLLFGLGLFINLIKEKLNLKEAK